MASSLFQASQSPQVNPQVLNKAKSIMQNANSPEMQMVSQMLRGKGMSAEAMVRMICNQKGINVDSFMQSIK